MKIDVNFDQETQTALITFFVKEMKANKDFSICQSIVQTFSADFNLDPELEREDLDEIIKVANEKGSNSFIFMINEEGIEVDIPLTQE